MSKRTMARPLSKRQRNVMAAATPGPKKKIAPTRLGAGVNNVVVKHELGAPQPMAGNGFGAAGKFVIRCSCPWYATGEFLQCVGAGKAHLKNPNVNEGKR